MNVSQGMALPPINLTLQVRVPYTTENTLSDVVSKRRRSLNNPMYPVKYFPFEMGDPVYK